MSLTPIPQGSFLFHWLCWYKHSWSHTINPITVKQSWLPINCQNEHPENLHMGKPRNCNGKTSQRIHRPSLVNLFKTLLPDFIWIRNSTLHLDCNGFLDLSMQRLRRQQKQNSCLWWQVPLFSPLPFLFPGYSLHSSYLRAIYTAVLKLRWITERINHVSTNCGELLKV